MADEVGAAPKVIVCDERLMAYFGNRLEHFSPPRFWEAPDPLARLREIGGEARVLIIYSGHPQFAELIDALPQLGCLLVPAAGYDGMDFDLLTKRGLALANNGTANSEDVADHAIALALAARREIIAGDRMVREGSWPPGGGVTRSFCTMRAGIVGYGHIGQAIARRLDGFGMETSWWGPRPKPGESRPRAESLKALAEASDLLIVACPGGEETYRIIDREIIEAVGPSGVIVTIARGAVTDEDALIAALVDGRLGAAALDVFEKEPTPTERWAGVPNTVLSPHRAAVTDGAKDRTVDVIEENIRRFLAGEDILFRIM